MTKVYPLAIRLLIFLIGSFCLAIEAFNLYGSTRAQGWISVVGFILIVAAGWVLLPNHSLGVVVLAFLLIPAGALSLVPIISQLGFVILIVLGVRWIILTVRDLIGKVARRLRR